MRMSKSARASGPSGPRRLKDRLRETTRAEILDAAERVFAREGFETGRMEQVAEAAGVSVGTLYNYFADRRTLVSELVEARRAELLHRVDQALERATADPIERLRALMIASFEHVEAHRPFVSLLVQDGIGECGVAGRRAATQPSTTFRVLQSRARAELERATGAGRLRGVDAAFVAHLLAGSVRSVVLYSLAEGEAIEPRGTADRILRVFLEGAGGA